MRGLLVAASVIFLIVACCHSAQAADPSLVAYWKFQNNTQDSAKANGLLISGNASYASGANGFGMKLNGTQYMKNSTTSGISIAPGSFSISAWIRPEKTTGDWRAILEYDRAGTSWFGIWLSDTGNLHFRVGHPSTMNSVSVLSPGRWYMLTATYNATNGESKLYINGTYDSSATLTPTGYWSAPSAGKVTIGVMGTESAEYFNGTVDEVRLWNRVLKPEEVTQIYANDSLMSSDDYYNKIYGAWTGEMAGNFLGSEWEFYWISSPCSNTTIYYHSPHGSDITGICQPDDYATCSVNSRGDDDTNIEVTDLHMLETRGIYPTYGDLRDEWISHITEIYFANRYGYKLMNGDWAPQTGPCSSAYVCTPSGKTCPTGGCYPPYSGMSGYNPYFDYIDSQIEIEVFGMLAPGMPKVAGEKADFFARVTNEGYAKDYAKFFAMMYAEAFYESNVTRIIDNVKARFRADSKVAQVVNNVSNWSRFYADWRSARQEIYNKYYVQERTTEGNGRGDSFFIHSTSNFALTIMAVLYSQGDFDKGIQIAALAGMDNDCTTATAAGLLGAISGYGDIPDKWKKPVRDYYPVNRAQLSADYITNISNRTLALGEQFILANGGRIVTTDDGNKIYTIDSEAGGLPPAWNPEPADQSLGQGQKFSYDANATDMGGIFSYSINDTAVFSINETNGVIINRTSLTPGGIYGLNISVNDTEGGTISKIITLAAGCNPYTCQSLGYECGSWSDGCGGTLNCGSCGSNGQCSDTLGICSCTAGYGNCNGQWSDGCETGLGTDANCASCGDACGTGESCQSGVCTVTENPPSGGGPTPGFEPSMLAILVATSLLVAFIRRN